MKKKNPLLPFFAVLVLFNMAASFVHPVTPTLIVERGLDSSMFGVALAAMMTMNFLFAPFWGKLCNYVPTKRIMLICGIGYAVGQTIFGTAQSELMVVGGRMFSGVFTGGAYTAFSNYVVNTTTDPRQRGQNLTTMITIQSVFGAVGYFVGGMLGLISVEAAFLTQIICLVTGGVIFYFICEDDTPYKHKPEKPLTVKEVNPFGAFAAARRFMTPMLALIFLIIAIAAIGQSSYEQCFNYYIKDQFGMSSAYNGTFKAVIAALTLALNATVSIYLQRRTDINKTFLPVMLACTGLISTILLFNNKILFVAIYIIYSAVNTVRLPLLQSMVANRATPENSNSMMGFYQSMNSLGGIFGALFAGLIYKQGPKLPFILAFAAFSIASVIGLVYVKKYKSEQVSA